MKRLLDLFCGAGGAGMGYHRAGFDVTGVDIQPQKHYPFEFMLTDALDYLMYHGHEYDAIHASPPCQAFTKAQKLRGRQHDDMIALVRDALNMSGKPWVIENVPGAPLVNPIVLNGMMFAGLRTRRTRHFETNWPIEVPLLVHPMPASQAKMGRPVRDDQWMQVVGHVSGVKQAREAMGIDWMTGAELAQAIPPAYTEFIGWQLMEHLREPVEKRRLEMRREKEAR